MHLAGSGPSTLFSKWGVTHAQSFFWLSKKLGSTLQFPTFLFHLSCLIIRLRNNCCWWGGGGGGWRLLGFTRPWGMNVRASVARVILFWIIPWASCKQQGCSFVLQTWLTLVHSVPKRLANGLALVPVPDFCCFYSGVFTDSIWPIFFKYSLGLKVGTGKEKKKTTKGSCDNVGRPGEDRSAQVRWGMGFRTSDGYLARGVEPERDEDKWTIREPFMYTKKLCSVGAGTRVSQSYICGFRCQLLCWLADDLKHNI